MEKLPVSAIVVGRNDGSFLQNCLSKLFFCDEIIYVDLESTDDSVSIAVAKGAVVVHHPVVPIVEIVHASISNQTKHHIILITDPDEILDDELIRQIPLLIKLLNDETNRYAAAYVPMINYFNGQRLKGTIWGGNYLGRTTLVNKNRFLFTPYVHNGRIPKDGFELYHVPRSNGNVVHHYWAQSKEQLVQKHKRYILREGEARYKKGMRSGIGKIVSVPFKSFYECLIAAKGYRDGFTGWWLSFFWAWYQTSCELKLYKYHQQHS
jgi:glycosyltransferase involved in cell wall biosynthesis